MKAEFIRAFKQIQIEFDKVWHRIEDFETVRQIIEEKFSEYLK